MRPYRLRNPQLALPFPYRTPPPSRLTQRAPSSESLIADLRNYTQPLNDDSDLDPLMERIGDARFVLLGEASHGTSEYYTYRARLSRRLIQEKGFSFVAVEGDWPDCYELNRYIKGYGGAAGSAYNVLQGFNRWPTWMWANWEVVAFAELLKEHNAKLPNEQKVGFYGLDVYSLWESLHSVLAHLEEHHPDTLETAKRAFRCFEPYDEDPQAYAQATAFVPTSCENEVLSLLQELRRQNVAYPDDYEAHFNAEQNAEVIINAERYYRTMIYGGSESWNIRDHHMTDTLERLIEHHGDGAKAIIWEHNTHIGDARATDMAGAGMVNVGQLARERYGEDDVVLVGFGSYEGSVIAGSAWGAPMERMRVPPAREGSWESLFHGAGSSDRLLIMRDIADNRAFFERLGHRAIGVVYHPERERYGNYVPTVLPERYDAFIYLDKTTALHPLHLEPDNSQAPELYPWGV